MSATDTPFVVARARVGSIERVSPNFVRIGFVGPEVHAIGTPGAVLDQRIKLVFPALGHPVPDLSGADADWWGAWLAIPEDVRGSMRTYSIRELVVDDDATTVVVDFVLHLEPGLTGPASSWASTAALGDEILLIGPRRGRTDAGGVEYAPRGATAVLLAGDETAAPAIARILEDADSSATGVAFIEVPDDADRLPISAPDGVTVRWMPRDGADHGARLIPSVLEYLGATAQVTVLDDGSEDLVWETPTYSGLGEDLAAGESHADRYFWIAGESRVVTTLRRHLVKDLGVDRAQVAFMGYWRRGVAMRG